MICREHEGGSKPKSQTSYEHIHESHGGCGVCSIQECSGGVWCARDLFFKHFVFRRELLERDLQARCNHHTQTRCIVNRCSSRAYVQMIYMMGERHRQMGRIKNRLHPKTICLSKCAFAPLLRKRTFFMYYYCAQCLGKALGPGPLLYTKTEHICVHV